MRKHFFAAVVPAVLLSTTSLAMAAGWHDHGPKAHADGLNLSGFFNFQSSVVDQDIDRNQRDLKFANDTEVHVTFHQKTAAGFTYGAVIELEADVTEDYEEQGLNADKTYLFIESSLGRFELGANNDAAAALAVDPSNFAAATGGTHGDYKTVALFPGDAHGGHAHGGSLAHLGHDDFIHHPSLPLHHKHGAAEDANKISYYTPRFSGFQVGGSYIVDTGDVGTASGFTGATGHSEYEHVVSGGVNYTGQFGPVSLDASATRQYGSEEVPNHHDLNAYALGVNLGYEGFRLGAAYGDWGKSLSHPSPTLEDAEYWSLGAGYATGPLNTSVTYMASEYHSNQAELVSFGADYQLAPGLTPYAELTLAAFDHSNAAIQDNDATVLLVGTMLNF